MKDLCSITFIKQTFPLLLLLAQKYYCAKSKIANEQFTNNEKDNVLVLGNNVDFKIDIQSNTDNLYKLDDTHPIDTNSTKNDYLTELHNVKLKFNFDDDSILNLTSTMDKYFFKFEQSLCYCIIRNSINECIGST